uniref:(northern house mosquito) hypothetical protein n=1 Tax=Culex pipiens TaxID=7175 RepID=A0A8D8A9R3_CULPI
MLPHVAGGDLRRPAKIYGSWKKIGFSLAVVVGGRYSSSGSSFDVGCGGGCRRPRKWRKSKNCSARGTEEKEEHVRGEERECLLAAFGTATLYSDRLNLEDVN